jgi:hypothetical protein
MVERLDVKAIAKEQAPEGTFPDARLTKRLETIVLGVGRSPTESFPSVFTSAELEGAYRFFSNPLVTMNAIVAPHFEATKVRVAEEACVRVVHDTTEFTYRRAGKRKGLCDRGHQGFSAHFSLALTADERREPLGLAGIHTWVRGANAEKEQSFWLAEIQASERTLGCGAKAVHICDRGADDYVLFDALIKGNHRFVVRARDNRYTESGPDDSRMKLRSILTTLEGVSERQATINGRVGRSDPKIRKIHPPREARTITLQIAAATINIARPGNANTAQGRDRLGHLPTTLAINVVRVWEPDPPDGAEPVEWILYTSEPIDTEEDVCAIVDHYRARWVIEEYFKALKTGCAFEQRQLDEYESLINALGVFAPLAYQILLLRTKARFSPDAPASTVATQDQIEVLRARGRRPLPQHPNARDILLAVAALGGHIKYAPDPGWLTIARGYEKLESLTEGWMAAKLQFQSDQR